MSRASTRGVTALCAVLALLALATAAAAAVSRARAGEIALRAAGAEHLRPVLVLGPTTPLGAGSWVADAGPDAADQSSARVSGDASNIVVEATKRVPRLTARAWLMWVDEYPNAYFEHTSVAVLVDARTGRVVERRTLAWWPLVDGSTPAFARPPGYGLPQYRVLEKGASAGIRADGSFASAPPSIGDSAFGPAAALAPGVNLSHDCFVTIGDRVDPQFEPDFEYIHALGEQLGVTTRDAVDETTLKATLQSLTSPARGSTACNDVALFMNAHGLDVGKLRSGASFSGYHWGSPAITLNGPELVETSVTSRSVQVSVRLPLFDSVQLTRVLRAFPSVKFKVLIDACYSGTWYGPLKKIPNVVMIATAANSHEPSYGGGVTRSGLVLPGAFTYGGGRTLLYWARSPRKVASAGRTLAQGLRYAYQPVHNPDAISHRTHPPIPFLRISGGEPGPPPPTAPHVLHVYLQGLDMKTTDENGFQRDLGTGNGGVVVTKPDGSTDTVGCTTEPACNGAGLYILRGGSKVALHAIALADSTFQGWEVKGTSKGCSGSSPTCTLTLSSDTTVTAVFADKTYVLTIDNKNPADGGVGNGAPGGEGISCGLEGDVVDNQCRAVERAYFDYYMVITPGQPNLEGQDYVIGNLDCDDGVAVVSDGNLAGSCHYTGEGDQTLTVDWTPGEGGVA